MRTTLAVLIVSLLPPVASAAPLKLDDGDRIVFLGNTLIEREQRSGWWELALTTRFPGKKLLFRNLGWSGDTVFGHARAGFGTVADGYKHLEEHVKVLKPTVLIVGYGSNEAFDGPEGLPGFTGGLNKLLDTLAATRARIILLSPLRQANLGKPLPDPAAQNRNLRLYADAIRDVAKKRDLTFIALYDLLGDLAEKQPGGPLTENGIHLTGRGYWWSAFALTKALGIETAGSRLTVDARSGKAEMAGGTVKHVGGSTPTFLVRADRLPWGGDVRHAPEAARPVVTVKGLNEGRYTLLIGGKPAATADAAAWAKGVVVANGPEAEQAEKVRKLIAAKNELYFHRWRPQNITYLYGFRKHEQGKNAREIPEFDPLVEAKEKEIARLSVPAEHTYQLVPAK